MPSPAPFGAPERGQTMISFTGAVRPIRPGPKPVDKTTIPFPPGTSFRGGFNGNEILKSFGRPRLIDDDTGSDDNSASDTPRKRKRTQWSKELKLDSIRYANTMHIKPTATKPGCLISKRQAAKDLGISTQTLRGWIENTQHIVNQKKGTKRNRNKFGIMMKAQEMEMERELYKIFQETRAKGKGCSLRWMMRKAKEIYRGLYPDRCVRRASGRGWRYAGFGFSEGWFNGFRSRYRISNRAATKQAQKAPHDMQSKVQAWLQYNRRQIAIRDGSHLGKAPGHYLSTDPTLPPCVGRFKLSEIANMDQTPLAFEFLDKHTYNEKGAKTVWLSEMRSGWDRRQATLQVCVFADGERRCKPQLIYHGAESGHATRTRERLQYHKGVDVLFNKKAWANEKTIIHWLRTTYKLASPYDRSFEEPRLLDMDAFSAHLTEDVRDEMKKLNIQGSFIPGGCTGYVQPLDVALNEPLKDLIKDASDRHYEDHKEEYEAGKFMTVGERRILLTHWVADAWKELHERYKETIISTFRRIGLSLKTDGSQDAEIQIKSLEGIEVRDWVLPAAELLSQETEAHNAMPLFSEARTARLQERREVRAAAKRAAKAAENGGIDVVESEDELPAVVPITQAARRRRAARVENWQYFVAGGAPVDFIPEVLEGGRTRGERAGRRELERFYTAEEAENGVLDLYDTDASLSSLDDDFLDNPFLSEDDEEEI